MSLRLNAAMSIGLYRKPVLKASPFFLAMEHIERHPQRLKKTTTTRPCHGYEVFST